MGVCSALASVGKSEIWCYGKTSVLAAVPPGSEAGKETAEMAGATRVSLFTFGSFLARTASQWQTSKEIRYCSGGWSAFCRPVFVKIVYPWCLGLHPICLWQVFTCAGGIAI